MGIEQVVALAAIVVAATISAATYFWVKARLFDAAIDEAVQPPKDIGDPFEEVANSVNYRNYK